AARPRPVTTTNAASVPSSTSAASLVISNSAAQMPSRYQERRCSSITACQKCSSTSAHSAIARIGGPNSGVGTANSEMPTISSTASAACDGPTMARPSVNTHQYVTTTQICDKA